MLLLSATTAGCSDADFDSTNALEYDNDKDEVAMKTPSIIITVIVVMKPDADFLLPLVVHMAFLLMLVSLQRSIVLDILLSAKYILYFSRLCDWKKILFQNLRSPLAMAITGVHMCCLFYGEKFYFKIQY